MNSLADNSPFMNSKGGENAIVNNDKYPLPDGIDHDKIITLLYV